MIRYEDLQESYIESMKAQLKDEFDDYVSSLSEDVVQGVRINTLKALPEEVFEKINTFHELIPWTNDGYYVDDTYKFTKHPYYYAGLYYVQEPSAMTPVSWLDVQKSDKVLDLCAAPGGKSTQIASKLGPDGTLYSNDPSASRCKALLKNIELAGIGNVVITCASPEELSNIYPDYFDRILVDAPCSGEGMFRKDRAVLNAYREHGPEYFEPIQREVLDNASLMLKKGGTMVFSTCTFSKMEDEDNVEWFLDSHKDFELIKMTKIYPHKVKGEGHFIAKFKRA